MSILRDKQTLFCRLAARLIEQAFVMGFEPVFGETYRTPEQAALNAKKGSGIANSLHCQRLAIDLILFKDGVWQQQSEQYAGLGAWWKQQHPLARWGGDFHSRPDGNHFSIEHEGVA